MHRIQGTPRHGDNRAFLGALLGLLLLPCRSGA